MIQLFLGLKRLLESVERDRYKAPVLCVKPDVKKIKKPIQQSGLAGV